MDSRQLKWAGAVLAASAIGLMAGCTQMSNMMHGGGGSGGGEHVALTGNNEVPPVGSSASGSGMVTVASDGAVTATIKVTGMTATAAHIHQGAPGSNGPVIVPFTKQGDNTFVAPPGAKMNEDQLKAYKAGNTYVNVHSDAHKGGEVRAQLKGS